MRKAGLQTGDISSRKERIDVGVSLYNGHEKLKASECKCYKSWRYINVTANKSWEGNALFEWTEMRVPADGKRVLLA